MPSPRLVALLAAACCAAVPLVAAAAQATPRACVERDTAGDWPSYGHDPSESRSQPVPQGIGPAAAARLTTSWSFRTEGALQSTPVYSHGCVYLTTSTGYVYAVDAASGTEVWHATLPYSAPGAIGGAIPGAPVVADGRLIVLVSQDSAPYAAAFDLADGTLLWRSRPVTTLPGNYTNASAAVHDGVVVFGYSPPEGSSTSQGGVALLDAATGAVLADVPTIPPAEQAKGYAGGGIWTTPAFDRDGYAYYGAGNPDSKTVEHDRTNAILKLDVQRGRATFGQVVASYKGNVDQYDASLQTLSQTPVCAASDVEGFTWPLDDPVCGQLDLDFGASPNLFPDASGRLLVGELQKSGTYHVAHADDMSAAWHTLVGGTCAVCNAASTAYDGSSIYVVGTPGGMLWSLDARTGASRWAVPVADGVHYQSLSVADGVVYTVDGNGFLDAWSAADGSVVLRRAMAADTGTPVGGMTSTGVSIANRTVFAAATDLQGTTGYLVAYRAS